MVISDLQYILIFSGMVVGVPDSALRGLGPDLGQNRWAVFFGKTLCYHSASLCCRVGTNDCQSGRAYLETPMINLVLTK